MHVTQGSVIYNQVSMIYIKHFANESGFVGKVLYCNSSFIRDLQSCAPSEYEPNKKGSLTAMQRKYDRILKSVIENDIVLIPYYPQAETII